MLVKSLTLLVAVTIAYVIGIRFASSSKIFSLFEMSSYFANGIDLCYRLSLLFELVTAFTSSL